MVKIGNVEVGKFPLLLAPMEDVSDPPFRMLCRRNGADVVYTEFISSEGLIRDAEKSLQKLDIFVEERPVGIQLFGSESEPIREAAQIAENSGPDIIDINFGCPVKKVTCKGGGAAILQNLPKMAEITREVVKAVSKPVTVKTRLGWDENSIKIIDVALMLQDCGISALSIHGRTRSQMYKGEANWEHIAKVKEHPLIKIPIFGNGDIDSPERALEYKNRYGVDGIMIGRASIGYPWIFNEIKHFIKTGEKLPPPTTKQRVDACREHLLTSIKWKGEKLGVVEMRRHYANYFKGFQNIKALRQILVTEHSPSVLLEVLEQIENSYPEYMEV